MTKVEQIERVNFILDRLKAGETIDQIDYALQRRYKLKAEKKGRLTESKAEYFLNSSRRLLNVQKASAVEDTCRGIDFWVSIPFRRNVHIIPVQIKSSEFGVLQFKNEEHYRNLREEILVLNIGFGINKKNFNKQLSRELERVLNLISKDPDYSLHSKN